MYVHNYVRASACHMTSTHIAESAHTRNRAIVTRPFSLAIAELEGWGLGTRLIKRMQLRPAHCSTLTSVYTRTVRVKRC